MDAMYTHILRTAIMALGQSQAPLKQARMVRENDVQLNKNDRV